MLPKHLRVAHKDEYKRVFDTAGGRRLHTPQFTVVAARNGFPHSRFGFIVSKKVGNSVVRHRTVRLLREAVRGNNFGDIDFIVIAKPNIVNGFRSEDLVRLLRKAASKV